jgi:hypothetical protein
VQHTSAETNSQNDHVVIICNGVFKHVLEYSSADDREGFPIRHMGFELNAKFETIVLMYQGR